jgi:murein DD-endopeptidase MepM/ murein hydrolase activator NlpD
VRAERARATPVFSARSRWFALGGLVAAFVAAFAAAFVAGRARAADVGAAATRASRDVSTLAVREALLAEQSGGARASARWRLRALYRLVVAGDGLAPATRARAIDAAARALARDLDESRTLAAEREHAHVDRLALTATAAVDPPSPADPSSPTSLTSLILGAPPAFALPVRGSVVARFGVTPERTTGLLVSRAGVRLGARAAEAVHAPAAGTVVRIEAEPGGLAVVLDHGAGWTTVVGGLAAAAVAPGERVAAGQRLGAVAGGAPRGAGVVAFEVWRGRRPVDPLLLARAATGSGGDPRPARAPAVH